MVVKKIFRENMPLEVYDQASEVYYKSIIQEVEDGKIAIGVPMKGQNQLMMREKKTYDLRMAVGDALYSFSCRVIGRRRSGNVSLFVLEWPDEIKRSQRRQFFRLPVSMDAHYWLLEKGSKGEESAGEELPEGVEGEEELKTPEVNLRQPLNKLVDSLGDPGKGLVVDISGGGLALVINRFIPEGSLLALRIFLQSKETKKVMMLKARVVRTFALDKESTGLKRYRLGTEFEDISEKVRDELINFIFLLSREKTH